MRKFWFFIALVAVMCFGISSGSERYIPSADANMIMLPLAGGGTPAASPSGVDWTADSNMVALYLFEDPEDNSTCNGSGDPYSCCDGSASGTNCMCSGTVDSVGNNDLSLSNGDDSPTIDSTNYIEGSQSASVEASGDDAFFLLSRADMDEDFPGNGTGDTEITIAGWIRIESYDANNYWVSIRDGNPNVITAAIYEADSEGSLAVTVDGTGGSATVTSTADCSLDTFYFVALSYSDSATTLAIYVREYGSETSTWTENTSADLDDLENMVLPTAVGLMEIGNGNGATMAPYGQVDAFAIFNGDALTQEELDGVFSNGWDGDGW
jgi:hypothetical protein